MRETLFQQIEVLGKAIIPNEKFKPNMRMKPYTEICMPLDSCLVLQLSFLFAHAWPRGSVGRVLTESGFKATKVKHSSCFKSFNSFPRVIFEIFEKKLKSQLKIHSTGYRHIIFTIQSYTAFSSLNKTYLVISVAFVYHMKVV